MSLLSRLFKRTATVAPLQLRDTDGKFMPHKLAVRSRALWLAEQMGRDDLIQRLSGATNSPADVRIMRQLPDGSGLEVVAPVPSIELPPATPERADRDFGSTRSPEGTSAAAGIGRALRGANDRDVATFNFGAMQ